MAGRGPRVGAVSLDVIRPSAAGLVATTGVERRPPPPPGCPPAGPVRVRTGGRSDVGGPPGTVISIGMLRHQSLNHPSANVFSTSLITPLNMSNASVLYSTRGSFCPQER